MSELALWRWKTLVETLPSVAIGSPRPASLQEVGWAKVLVFTATNEVTAEEIFNYLADLTRYYPMSEMEWLMRQIEENAHRSGRAGRYIRLIRDQLNRLICN